MIKAIETKYKGYRFRSRLEARWAVFFDELGLPWEYEKEGFNYNGIYYLPDFYFPTLKIWAEVKPEKFTKEEFIKVAALEGGGLVLDGYPECRNFIFAGLKCCCVECGSCPEEEGYNAYCYDCYLNWEWKDYVWSIDLVGSAYKGSVWFSWGNRGYINERAVNAARSARFEFGESGSDKEITDGR